jgi:predicted nucleic acid-binding protein
MVFSYHLGRHPRYTPLTHAVLAAVESGQVEGLTTTLTLAELLTRPAQANDQRAMRDYELYITRFPNLVFAPLDAGLARHAARVRALTRLRMPDAIQVAAAQLYRADAIVTNDRRWRNRVHSPALILLDDFL